MTIDEAINTLDSQKTNTFSRQDKLRWLSRLDETIYRELILTHEGPAPAFSGYDEKTDPKTTLLVPSPWDEIYLRYLQAQIDYANGEMTRYANGAALYNACLAAYTNFYNRTHAPKGGRWRYF